MTLLSLCLLAATGCRSGETGKSGQEASLSPLERRMISVRERPDRMEERVALADAYLEAKETYPAIEQLEIVLQSGHQDEAVVGKLARMYETAGEFEAAAQTLGKAAKGPSASVALHLAYSRALFRLGDFAGAAQASASVLPAWQSLPDSEKQYVVRSFLLADDTKRGGDLLPTAPPEVGWIALRGLHALLTDRPREAQSAFAEVARQRPTDAWNLYQRGQAAQLAGDPAQAISSWKRADTLPDSPIRARTGLAKIAVQQGDLQTAKAALQRIGKSGQEDPDTWDAWSRIAQKERQTVQEGLTRGYVAFYSGDPWLAETIWKQTLPTAKGEDARELYAALYNSAFRRHDMDTAFRMASEASRRWPQDAFFLKRKAEVLLGQNLLPQALAEAEQLKRIAPPDQEAEVCELLARIGLDSGRADLLEPNARRRQELLPNDPDPLLHLAEWQAQKGRSPVNLEATLALYRKAISVAPQNAEAYARAGGVLADLKRPQEAMVMLQHALTLSPSVMDGTPHAQLAQLYQKEGLERERQLEESRYQQRRRAREGWPTLLKALRQERRPVSEWKALGEMALERRENWIALCAFNRATGQAPQDSAAWRSLAATYKRLNRFDDALAAMRRAHRTRRKQEG